MSRNNSFRCPYCGAYMPNIPDTERYAFMSFRSLGLRAALSNNDSSFHDGYAYMFCFHRCPKCEEVTVYAVGVGKNVAGKIVNLSPNSSARQFPDYIPQAIRSDYEEACAIVTLSPKASATLSRRCLQGMIRDFWNIHEDNLSKAIQKLHGSIPATQWNAIDALRRIGNIGAHMEADVNLIVDIDPDEAEKLIKLIELLMDKWYVARQDEDDLLKYITQMNAEKQAQRNP